MTDADDASIMRLVVRAVAAAILCLLCGGIAGIFVVRGDDGFGSGNQRVQLPPAQTSPG